LTNLATSDLRAALRRALLLAEADALETALNAAGVPAAHVRDLGEFLAGLYPHTPGIGLAGEPVGFDVPFRWQRKQPLALPPAPRPGADNDLFPG
jgi:crotonobetainyl-CoA:carnitine CoA-transferase CaiB-like acyl-CoA transferase